ncbi:hypothetical protein AAEJ74_20245 [Limnospira fusiformis PMC 851.14]|uniref:Uncharacterized protein n=1 Tax=Limnospira fusiformis PMC 851.14 TaxID=2219512 RepID=A0ABU9EPR6_LIMFS
MKLPHRNLTKPAPPEKAVGAGSAVNETSHRNLTKPPPPTDNVGRRSAVNETSPPEF